MKFSLLLLISLITLSGCVIQNNNSHTSSTTTTQAETTTYLTTSTTEPKTIYKEVLVEADDIGLYPNILTVNKGDNVKVTFVVRTSKVYYGGLDFRSDTGNYFKTNTVKPGESMTVQFVADKPFTYTSYWPKSNVDKAQGKINVV